MAAHHMPDPKRFQEKEKLISIKYLLTAVSVSSTLVAFVRRYSGIEDAYCSKLVRHEDKHILDHM
jgi:hypothetical protein